LENYPNCSKCSLLPNPLFWSAKNGTRTSTTWYRLWLNTNKTVKRWSWFTPFRTESCWQKTNSEQTSSAPKPLGKKSQFLRYSSWQSQKSRNEKGFPETNEIPQTYPLSAISLGAAPSTHVAGNGRYGLWRGVVERGRLRIEWEKR
jgi:hypothetical protein